MMSLALLPAPLNGAQNDPHLGLPPVPVVSTNLQTPEKIALGHDLFFDPRFSADQKVACASCHDPSLAFSDGRKVAQGASARNGMRNTPSLIMAAYGSSFFWDGRRDSLEEQAIDPMLNPVEHGLENADAVLRVVRGDSKYGQAFESAFGVTRENIRTEHIAKALASYQRSLAVGDSLFDRYYYGDDKQALSDAAIRGLQLFQGRGQCVTCHAIGKEGALFTDNQFHLLGVGFSNIQMRLAETATRVVKARGESLDRLILADAGISELGRFSVTAQPSDIGKFKTPSLRNVATTAPYMHDGSLSTLEEAVDVEIYYRSVELGRPLVLTPVEKHELVEFLKSLTSPQFLGGVTRGEK